MTHLTKQRLKNLHALPIALLLNGAFSPTSQADQTTQGVQLRILPRLDAKLTLPASPQNLPSLPPTTLLTPIDNNQLCITHTRQTLYSIDTQSAFSQRELPPSKSHSKPIGYDFIQTLQTRSNTESSDNITRNKADLSRATHKTTCTKLAYLIGSLDTLSDTDNSFADDGTLRVITVTINAE